VSSNRDFGVEQFFQADEFWADDPSPLIQLKKKKGGKKELHNYWWNSEIENRKERGTEKDGQNLNWLWKIWKTVITF
jgi:hypothetical protein